MQAALAGVFCDRWQGLTNVNPCTAPSLGIQKLTHQFVLGQDASLANRADVLAQQAACTGTTNNDGDMKHLIRAPWV